MRTGEELSIACASVAGIEGRASKFLQAVKGLDLDWRLTWMVDPSEVSSALSLVREFGIAEERIEIVSPRSIASWSQLVARSDIALHLHTSTFGHLAPFVQISLAEGVPVVVEQSGQGEDIPEQAAFRVVPGLHEAAQLKEIFKLVSEQGATQLGEPGRAYIERVGDPDMIAKRLSEGFVSWAPRLKEVWRRWDQIGARARNQLIDEVRGLVSAQGAAELEIDPFNAVIAPAIRDLGW
jgi:hypothetical protein